MENELETMIVRLIGDGSEYQAMLEESVSYTEDAADNLETAGRQLSESFNKQLDTIGMTSRELEIYNAAIAGATNDQLEYARAIDAMLTEQEQQVAAVKEGARITETVATAEEKYAACVEHLEELLHRGAISQDVFNRALEQAKERIYGVEKQVDEATSKLKLMAEALEAFGAVEFLKKSFEAFSERESTQIRLNAVMQAGSRDVKTLTEDYSKFAEALAEVTTVSKRQTLDMLTLAEAEGLTGDQAKAAAKNAAALAAVFKTSAEGEMRAAIHLAQGNTMLLKRRLGLRDVKDETEIAARIQKVLNAGMAIQAATTNTTEGAMHHLTIATKQLYADFGQVVEAGVKPFVQGLKFVVEWLRELSPETKKAIVAVAALVALGVSIGPMLAALGFIVSTVFSPIVVAVVAAGLAVNYFIDQVGGVEEAWKLVKEGGLAAWDYVKAKTAEFLAWFQPATRAISSFGSAAWDEIKGAAEAVWDWLAARFDDVKDYAQSMWPSIADSTVWDTVRDAITNAFIAGEFVIRNFGAVWGVVTDGAAFKAVELFNIITHFFMETIPATFDWFTTNWKDIFRDIYEFTKTVFSNMSSNIVALMANLPGLIKGTVKFEDIWTPMLEDFKATTKKLVLPEREIGALEKQLKEAYEKSSDALGESFETFRKKKLEEFGIKEDDVLPPERVRKVEKDALDVGTGIGQALKHGTQKEKFDAALAGSADALTRLAEYKDKLEGKGKEHGGEKKFEATAVGSAEAASREDKNTEILKDIRNAVQDANKKPKIELAGANL